MHRRATATAVGVLIALSFAAAQTPENAAGAADPPTREALATRLDWTAGGETFQLPRMSGGSASDSTK